MLNLFSLPVVDMLCAARHLLFQNALQSSTSFLFTDLVSFTTLQEALVGVAVVVVAVPHEDAAVSVAAVVAALAAVVDLAVAVVVVAAAAVVELAAVAAAEVAAAVAALAE